MQKVEVKNAEVNRSCRYFIILTSDFCIRQALTIDPIFSPITTRLILPC